MNAIVLVVDGLHVAYSGAYGNTWVDTPRLDHLASQSLVFDQALVDSPQLAVLCRGWWQALGAIVPPQVVPVEQATLMRRLHQADVATCLISDEPAVHGHPLAADFAERRRLALGDPLELATSIHETRLAAALAEVALWLESVGEPFLLWVHLTGLRAAWDAPYALRQQFVEEDDELPPPRDVGVPCGRLHADHDPDELLAIRRAYAGQVAVLDACIGGLLEFVDQQPWAAQTLFSLLGARGFALGEHGRVGDADLALYDELVHVPWWLRLPRADRESIRTQALVEPADLAATLLDWWQLPAPAPPSQGRSLLPLIDGDRDDWRDRLLLSGEDDQAIRTAAWYLRRPSSDRPLGTDGVAGPDASPAARTAGAVSAPPEDAPAAREPHIPDALPELYVKPDDRWEQNDVASRCSDVVEQLIAVDDQCRQAAAAGRPQPGEPLSEVLRTGWA